MRSFGLTSRCLRVTYTDRYLDFASHHPIAHNIAIVQTLHSRAEAISSSLPARDKETKHLRQALISNGYPTDVIKRHSRTINPPGPANQREARSQSVTLPYVRGVSEAVRRILTPLGVRVSFRPNVTLRHLLVRPKDRIPVNETTGVVYQVPCASCPATYVGQTGRRLDQWLRDHRRAVESGDCANSALAEHAWGHHHPVDWCNTEVLDHHPDIHQRLVLESVHIRSQSDPLNRDNGSMPQVYSPLF